MFVYINFIILHHDFSKPVGIFYSIVYKFPNFIVQVFKCYSSLYKKQRILGLYHSIYSSLRLKSLWIVDQSLSDRPSKSNCADWCQVLFYIRTVHQSLFLTSQRLPYPVSSNHRRINCSSCASWWLELDSLVMPFINFQRNILWLLIIYFHIQM